MFRPRTQCDLRDATKLIATGAASCLDCHSAHDSHHIMGQFGWVSIFRKIAFALCSLKAMTQRRFAGGAPRSYFLSNGGISAGQRALNHEASCWNPRIISHPGRAEEYFFDHTPRLRRRQSFAKIGDRPVHVSIENFTKELLLVAKCSVKTWSIDAHGPCQIGKRSAFVTFGPKNVHRTIQGRVRIERARSAALCCNSS